ncbi:MAG TPA: hypothetical protein VIK01_14490 [Polyangiaceae bacterium]
MNQVLRRSCYAWQAMRPALACVVLRLGSAFRISATPTGEGRRNPSARHIRPHYSVCLDVRRPGTEFRAVVLVACCLVLLQLVTALHFALVPHGFSAGLNGFVHVHAAFAEQRSGAGHAEHVASQRPSLVSDAASCAPESCPIGFAGPHSLLLASAQAAGLLELAVTAQALPPARFAVPCGRALLNAPKTSPPFRV